ncbi:tetratricopeptide repeat protein [Rhodothermus marinus]|jgi:tetratricopeptide (TPR) repeat protein|uniref:tetratricopeptide repeat protein n=1 Tax=Rhodothermus marinus TaxID=29549 RepID=UPI001DC8CA51|nr:hypothetical protein [Rhodothermus marinus]MBO2492351.1 hypothetical protein [Rhodothermus marinus]
MTNGSFLENFRLPLPAFERTERLGAQLCALWEAVRRQEARRVLTRATSLLALPEMAAPETRAALLNAMGAARLQLRHYEAAERMLRLSLAALPDQWMATRLLVHVCEVQRRYEAAYDLLERMQACPSEPSWDEPLTEAEWHLGMATLAWRLRRWKAVGTHVRAAFPKVTEMPPALQADLLRLAFYRGRPAEALAMARHLLERQPDEQAVDTLLQTFVQQGWKQEACMLYRQAYQRYPESERFRRRLVALCLQTGAVEEARRLARLGVLSMDVEP